MLEKDAAHQIALDAGWLRRTPPPFQRAVLERCRLEQFAAGTPVYSVGDEPGGMFGIVSGCLGVSVAPRESGPYLAHLALPGTWFGEAAAFTRQPRRVGLIASRDSELLHLSLRAIDDIVRRDPVAWRYFGLITIDHLAVAVAGSDALMIRDHFKRFIAVLLRLGNTRPQNGEPIQVDVSHEDLAHMANVARTTAGAILRKLEVEGHVVLAYRRIKILAPDALRRKLRD
ncbi:Crp/Fnr family transcriptional regulator [Bradyrhizobium sp. 41S5]|uniref:Crp/Fnr family transcriptional regulator n=1 Tax=Bradyrhizobium sp. 41S5 TaxID=1404443 RepID=UPI00156B5CE5|nr:Crp/Fnr family transcriptional regulator [Bradyrhizobium sp. 41S5]UFX44458.1 Crp/Fnr family transcriptional regulator [Bradyrhizobium sp. 41S5]